MLVASFRPQDEETRCDVMSLGCEIISEPLSHISYNDVRVPWNKHDVFVATSCNALFSVINDLSLVKRSDLGNQSNLMIIKKVIQRLGLSVRYITQSKSAMSCDKILLIVGGKRVSRVLDCFSIIIEFISVRDIALLLDALNRLYNQLNKISIAYLRGNHITMNLKQCFPNMAEYFTYQVEYVQKLSDIFIGSITKIDVLLLYSANTASNLSSLAGMFDWSHANAISMSAKINSALTINCGKRIISHEPNHVDMMRALSKLKAQVLN